MGGTDDFETAIASADWNSLTHAGGSAADVPAMLRAVVTGRDDESEEAMSQLVDVIYAAGRIYDAAPAVARALTAAISTAPLDAPFACGTLDFLGACATAQDREALDIVARCRDELVAKAPAFVRWLDADAESTRIEAVLLASDAKLPGAVDRGYERFLGEPSLYVRLATIPLLALDRSRGDALASLRTQTDERAVALGLVLAESGVRGAPVDALREASLKDWLDLFDSIPTPRLEPIELLRGVAPELACPVLVTAVEALGEFDSGKTVERHARAVCEIALRTQRAFDPKALSDAERALLARLVDAEAVWRSDTPWMALVERLGIRGFTRDVRQPLVRSLGLTPKLVCVFVRPRDVPDATVICERFGDASWAEGTFVFFRGDPSPLDGPFGAAAARTNSLDDVARRLQSKYAADVTPTAIGVYRFYPARDPQSLAAIATAHGADVRSAPR